jgi:glycosyltransferase involved in cell wall biosynthesis
VSNQRTPVSVIIPAYNHAHFVADAIESAAAQDHPPSEIIVVNDGSTDDTSSIVAAYPSVTLVMQRNRGLAEARNAGLAHSSGEFVVFLDADDRLLPGAIRIGARLLAADPSAGFAAGYSRFVSGDGTPQPTSQPRRIGDDPYVALLRRNSIRNPAMVMFRRSTLDAVGGFDPSVNACADYELYLRISRDHPVAFHDAIVADYRKHGRNMSDNSGLMLRELGIVMRRQRPYLVTRARREAFGEGLSNVREYYGDRLVNQIRARIEQRTGWVQTAEDVATLMRHHPAGLIEHARRKIRLLRNGFG